MSKAVLVVLTVAALFVAQAVYWLIRYLAERRQERVLRRLRTVGTLPATPQVVLLRPGRLARAEPLDRALRRLPLLPGLGRLIAQTDLEWTATTLLGYAGVGFLLGGTAGVLLGSGRLAAGLGALLAAAPLGYVLHLRAARSQAISRQLPEALDMICRSLRAGHALPTAFKAAAQELPPPIATEFARCYEEQLLGVSVERALLNMTDRVPGNLDLRIMVVAVLIQQHVGGNLAEVLERIGAMIRERYRFYGHLRALTAEGRWSAAILAVLPWLVLVAIWIIRPGYLVEFWSDPLGKRMAGFAFGLWLTGLVWIRRTTQVEV